MRCTADTGKRAGCTIWRGIETWQREGQWKTGVLGGHLLVYKTVCLVVGFLFLLLGLLSPVVPSLKYALRFGRLLADVVTVVDVACVAGSWARPETCDAVVGARREDVAERVPVQRPDGEVVGVLDAMGGVYGLYGGVLRVGRIVGGGGGCGAGGWVLLVEQVVVDAAVDAARGQQVLVHGVPGHGDDVLFVPLEEQDVAHHADIEDACGVVTGACC